MNTTIHEHPIFNNSHFFIRTPMINKLADQINRCIWNGNAGAAVYGDYRIGKSRALGYTQDCLINRLGEKIHVRSISVAPRDQGTIAGVFKNICHSIGITLKSRATSDDMSNLILHNLGELSLANNTKQVCLIVDEFQRLNVSQLEAFAELYDGLVTCGSNLFVLFVGNDSASLKLRKNIHEDHNELIRGRFFTQEFLFYGIHSFEEVRYCLREYDTRRFPEDGPSYTEYFLRDIAPENWKLESLSEQVWSIYHDEFRIQLDIKSWPMQYFTSMVRVLLTDFLPEHGVDDDKLIREMIIESIRVSGLVKNLVH